MNGLSSRFARLRVSRLHRAMNGPAKPTKEWLLIEWPEGREGADQVLALDFAEQHTHSAIWSMPPSCRWRIERDYQELKQEVGLGHYEGTRLAWLSSSRPRCASQPTDFLVSERETIPPLRTSSRRAAPCNLPLPDSYPTPEDPPIGGLSATSQIRSPPVAPTHHRRAPSDACHDVPCCVAPQPRDRGPV